MKWLRDLFRPTDWRATGNRRWHPTKAAGAYRLEVRQSEHIDMNTGRTEWRDDWDGGCCVLTGERQDQRVERLTPAPESAT